MDIKQYKLHPKLIEYLYSKKINDYLPVQNKVIPLLLKEKNVLVEAPTGTGKTLSFLLPILTKIIPHKEKIQFVLFVPTRELANQIWSVVQEIKKFLDFSVLLAIGGEEKEKQLQKLNNEPDLIIATPGRLNLLLEKSFVKFDNIKYVSIDEADMIIDFGFWSDVEKFFNKYINYKISVSMFSATLPESLQYFISKQIKGPVEKIIIENEQDYLTINLVKAFDNDRNEALLKLINSNIMNPYTALIFTKTNQEAIKVYETLKFKGIKNVGLFSSSLEQRERNKVVRGIKNEQYFYLVTTDLMARGIDFIGISHIINYNLPVDLNYYRHRIGRTNRRNTKGVIFDIYIDQDLYKYDKIIKKNNWIKIKKIKI